MDYLPVERGKNPEGPEGTRIPLPPFKGEPLPSLLPPFVGVLLESAPLESNPEIPER